MKKCNVCFSVFVPSKYNKNHQKYCSSVCLGRAMKNKERYGGLKYKALERDDFRCTRCGMARLEHIKKWGKDLTINHKDGSGFYTPKHLKNNALSNLETLCLSCHNKVDNAYVNLVSYAYTHKI